jgi:hypothetical protein
MSRRLVFTPVTSGTTETLDGISWPVAVGSLGALYDDGSSWGRTASATLGAVGRSGTAFLAVGADGDSGIIMRSWDGQRWSTVWRDDTSYLSGFNGIWSGTDDTYVVGAACPTATCTAARGWILHSGDSGDTWTTSLSGFADGLAAVWGSGPSDVYVVGFHGTILHSTDGHAWTPQVSGATALHAIWGSGPDDVFVVGGNGVLLHTTNGGQSWVSLNSGTSWDLNAIWGSGPGDIYVVGEGRTILHSSDDGQTWTPQLDGISDVFYGVWGRGPDITGTGEYVYVVGSGGTMLRGH